MRALFLVPLLLLATSCERESRTFRKMPANDTHPDVARLLRSAGIVVPGERAV